MRIVRKYVLETSDGRWRQWYITPFMEWRHPSYVPRDGAITIEKVKYVVDPMTIRRHIYRRWSFLPFKEQAEVYLWKEKDPEPIPFFKSKPRDDDITGDVISTLSRSERLSRIVSQGPNYMAIIAILAIVAAIVMGIALYSK